MFTTITRAILGGAKHFADHLKWNISRSVKITKLVITW